MEEGAWKLNIVLYNTLPGVHLYQPTHFRLVSQVLVLSR